MFPGKPGPKEAGEESDPEEMRNQHREGRSTQLEAVGWMQLPTWLGTFVILVTSAKERLCFRCCVVCLIVCPFVCHLDYTKNNRPIFMKLAWRGVAWTKEEPIKCWSGLGSRGRSMIHFLCNVCPRRRRLSYLFRRVSVCVYVCVCVSVRESIYVVVVPAELSKASVLLVDERVQRERECLCHVSLCRS